MSAPLQPRPNPYVGPRPFQYGEPLFGRDREAMELLDLLIAERIVLLYSPSGAGKTSLMQAGLIPELEKEGFQVLPVMRVSLEPPPELARSAIANRYVLSLLLSLEEALPAAQQMPLAELAGMELAEYLEQRSLGADESEPLVLIFDQFEEILTVDPTDRTAKEAFFAQVGAALRQRQRWALFAMREEYPAGLDPYLRPLPTRLSTTFRLELLEEEAARLAMEQPARQVGVGFTDAAARQLVNDLRRVRVQRPDGTTEEQPGLYVEPVQLQVVCRRLWENLPAEATQIGEEDVAAAGDVDSALSGYYAERVAAIAGQTGVRERAIREWCDRHLITQQGIRGQVLQGHAESEGLENRAITPLVDAHLVRAEKRRGATWFELAHDRLIEPVRQNNAVWYQANLSALQRQAALWEEQHRSPGLLLGGEALEEAERWADTPQDELTSAEHDFLAACREARAIAERERRQALRIRRLAIAASIIGAIAVMAFVVASYQSWKASQATNVALGEKARAEDQAEKARQAEARAEKRQVEAENLLNTSIAQSLAAQALHQLENQKEHESSALLARQAFIFHQLGAGRVMAQIDSVLRTVLSSPYFSSVLRGHADVVWSVAFSPDGKPLASGSKDTTIRLWDLGTPDAEPTVLRGDVGVVRSVAFSPDGKRLASSSEDATIRLWDLGTPDAEPTVLRGDAGWVWSVAFSPDGKRLASGSRDTTIRLWDLGTPDAEPTVLRGDAGAGWSVAFSPDGKRLASGSEDTTIRLWDLGTPDAEPTVLRGHAWGVESVAFSPDGKRLASGSEDTTIRLWDLGTPDAEPTVLRGHARGVESVAFSPDGKRLASGSEDTTIRLWDLGTPDAEPTVLRGHAWGVGSVAFSPDGKRLASGSEDTTIRLWDLGTPDAEPTVLRGDAGWVWSVAFSPDGKRLASGNGYTTIRLWDLGTPDAEPTVLRGDAGGVGSVAFSPEGKRLASGNGDTTIRLWDLGTPDAEPTVLRGHAGGVESVAFSPDGKRLASGSKDTTIRLWDLGTPDAEPTVLRGDAGGVGSVAFSPDGKRLASGSEDSTIRLWDLGTPDAEPTVLRGDAGGVGSVAFSPDGKRLASGSEDATIRLWDLGTPDAEPTVLRGHARGVGSVAFSPDGKRLASGSWDSTIRLWDLGTPDAEPTILRGDARGVRSVAFSPDGKRLASGSEDNSIRIWATTEALTDRVCEKVRRNLTLDEWRRSVGLGTLYRRTCSNLPIHHPSFVAEGEQLAKQGMVKEALAVYTEAQALDPRLRISAQSWNELCWQGSLRGHAAEVKQACEQAVTLAPEDGGTRDSRGLARALTGDIEGAIADFQAFIVWAQGEQQKAQRQRWIDELRSGKNPFTSEELKKLRNQ